MNMKTDPWNAILISYAQTGTLPPCPFCSQDALTAEQNNSCAHIGVFVYCSNCGKWTHADGNLGKAQSMD